MAVTSPFAHTREGYGCDCSSFAQTFVTTLLLPLISRWDTRSSNPNKPSHIVEAHAAEVRALM